MTEPTLLQAAPFQRDRFPWLAYWMLAYYAYMQAALGPLMPFLRAELGMSYTVAGLHLSAFALGMVLAGLTGDRLALKLSRYVVFWAGAAGMAVGGVGLALSSQTVLTIGSILAMGWLGSLVLVMIQAMLSDRHQEKRAIALTESNVMASVFAALAPLLIGGFQRTGFGWRSALYFGAATLLVMGLLFKAQPVPEPRRAVEDKSSSRKLPLLFWGYWLVVVLSVSVEWCLIFWGADFLENQAGLARVDAATAMSVFFGAMIVGRFWGSRLTRTTPGANLLTLALSTALVGFPLFWLARSPVLNIVGLFITGLGVANLFPLTLSVAVGVAARQIDQASARLSMGGGTAILLAPLVLGWFADQVGIYLAYGLVVVLLVAALSLVLITNRLARR